MKFLPIFTIIVISSLLSMYESVIKVVSADVMVRYVFNNGVSPKADTYCSDSDNGKIDEIFKLGSNRRHLRHNNAKEAMPRELKTYPRYCKNNCVKYAPGTCRATNCLGFRRSLNRVGRREASVPAEHAQTCSESLTTIQKQLDELILKNLVSNTCKVFLKNSTRTSACYDDVVYGEVEGYRIWNLTSSRSGKSSPFILYESDNMTISGGYEFCKRTVFNVEIMTNDCVDDLKIIAEGPRGYDLERTEGYIPYTLFSGTTSDNTDPSKGSISLLGNTLPYVGSYTITVIPDFMQTKSKQFVFKILDC